MPSEKIPDYGYSNQVDNHIAMMLDYKPNIVKKPGGAKAGGKHARKTFYKKTLNTILDEDDD